MSRDGNWFFGRHFVIVFPIVDFFALSFFFFFLDYVISGPHFTAQFIRKSTFLT